MNLNKHIALIGFIALATLSCKQEVVKPDNLDSFNVIADSTNYTLGSKTTFNFSGNPFTITFFSGEQGHQYIYRNRTSAPGTSRFIFTNALNVGTQTNTLHVMLSANFKGVVVGDTSTTIANIAAATWQDITPTVMATNATAVTDTINLNSYAAAGKPVFIAFKYTAQSGSIQNKWTITNVNLTNTLADNSVYTIANLNVPTTPIVNYGGFNSSSPGWVAYTPTSTKKWTVGASSLVIDSTTAASTVNSESWTLMGSVDLTRVTPDVGVPIKSITALPVSYPYIYAASGTYSATFMAANNSRYTSDTIARIVPVVIR